MNAISKTSAAVGVTVIAAASLATAGCTMADGTHMSNMNATSQAASQPMSDTSMDMHNTSMSNRFGGPVYKGKPALPVTVALVMAGGGPSNFSFSTALVHMLGKQTVNAEVAKLTRQYGAQRVNNWLEVMDFYVNDTLKIAQAKGIKLPAPADLSGTELARTLIKAGTAPDGTFWAGYFFDHAVSHAIHNQLMTDADVMYSATWDGNAHAITNQAMYDVAQALDMNDVKLAPFH